MNRRPILSDLLVIGCCFMGVAMVFFGDRTDGLLLIVIGYLVSMDDRL